MQRLTRKTLHELHDTLMPEIKIRKPQEKEAYIIVGMGDCGIQKGSKEIFKIISGKIDDMGKRGDIAVLQSELAGLCEAEPIVEVVLKGEKPVKYGYVTPEIAKEIIDSHVVNKKVLSKYVLDISKKAEVQHAV